MAGKKMTFEYRKGQEIKVRIIDIGMRGEGIGKLEDGYTVFMKGSANWRTDIPSLSRTLWSEIMSGRAS